MSWRQIGDAAQAVVDSLSCPHPNPRLVWTEFSNYGDRYQKPRLRHFCRDCGWLIGSELKHSLATNNTPTLSQEEVTRAERMRSEHFQRLELAREQQQEERRAQYHNYLLSPEWAQKREAVLERASGRCEGCRTAEATQVHHLTYEHCGNEFLWELVAICRACHSRFHGFANE
jgi:hypothetical protein